MLGFSATCRALTPRSLRTWSVLLLRGGGVTVRATTLHAGPAVVAGKVFHALHQQPSHGQRPQRDGKPGCSPSGLGLGYA